MGNYNIKGHGTQKDISIKTGQLARERDTYQNGCITMVPRLLGCGATFDPKMTKKTTDNETCKGFTFDLYEANEKVMEIKKTEKQVELEEIDKKVKKKSHLSTVPVFWAVSEIVRNRKENMQHKEQVEIRRKAAMQYKYYEEQSDKSLKYFEPTSFELANQFEEKQEAQVKKNVLSSNLFNVKRKQEEDDKPNKRKATLDWSDSNYCKKFYDCLTELYRAPSNKRAKMGQETLDENKHTSDDAGKVDENVEKMENEHPGSLLEFKMGFYVEPTSFELANQFEEEREKQLKAQVKKNILSFSNLFNVKRKQEEDDKPNKRKVTLDLSDPTYSKIFYDCLIEMYGAPSNKMGQETLDETKHTSNNAGKKRKRRRQRKRKVGKNVEEMENEPKKGLPEFKMGFYVMRDS